MQSVGDQAARGTLTEPRPLGELFSELAQETGALVRNEVELAKVEMTAKAKVAGRDAALVAGGASIVLLGVMALLGALILALGTVIPLWASALLVGAVVTGLGGILAVLGIRAFKGIEAAPRETMQTLQENKRWLRQQVSR
jgi:putative superfamily III holin-X